MKLRKRHKSNQYKYFLINKVNRNVMRKLSITIRSALFKVFGV